LSAIASTAEMGAFAFGFGGGCASSDVTMRGMACGAFDTFRAARALESAGVERAQAEAIANAIQRRQDYATKLDLAALETRLTHRIYAVAMGLAATVAAFGLFT